MVVKIQKLMEQVRQEEITLRKTELKALQAQINPHFLYNTLDAIAWMCEDGKNEDAEEMVTALARLFRISISNCLLYTSHKAFIGCEICRIVKIAGCFSFGNGVLIFLGHEFEDVYKRQTLLSAFTLTMWLDVLRSFGLV